MTTLYDLGVEVQNIKNLLNNIEVKGQQNASLLVTACLRCDAIIKTINDIGKAVSEKEKNNEETNEPESSTVEGDVDAE